MRPAVFRLPGNRICHLHDLYICSSVACYSEPLRFTTQILTTRLRGTKQRYHFQSGHPSLGNNFGECVGKRGDDFFAFLPFWTCLANVGYGTKHAVTALAG